MKRVTVLVSAIICCLLISNCNGQPEYDIKKKSVKSIKVYKTAFVEAVEFDTQKDATHGYGFTLSYLIGEYLKDLSLEQVYVERDAEVKLHCSYSLVYGIPRMNLRWAINWKYLNVINLKIIDLSTNEIIGEAEYIRPLGNTSDASIVKLLMDMLEGSVQKSHAQ